MKLKKHLNFTSFREELSACFNKIPEHRQASKVDYSIHDALMSGFACMHFQDPSLLQFQQRLEKKHHKNNLQTLLHIKKIPGSTQLRSITDKIDSQHFSRFFDGYFRRLQRGKQLKQFQLFEDLYLMPMDATEYFSSNAISCDRCLRSKTKKKGKEQTEEYYEYEEHEESPFRYSHKALQVGIMHPNMKQVIPFMPESIHNTDGKTKQDCEMNAAKRLLPKIRKSHPQLGIIVAGDDLFSRQPMIEATLAARMHYIYVAKPTSHQYLYEWLAGYPQLNHYGQREIIGKKKKTEVRHCYEWMNQVPLHGAENSIQVNYFHYKMLTKNEAGKEIIVYQNSWVTDFEITSENVRLLVNGGRCRWKVENECFNTLKNQGYVIDHSYGHGEKNLCFNFYLLTLIAFTIHQLFELTDELYQTCRLHFGSKKNLWNYLRSYINLLIFDSWESLLSFTLNPEHYLPEKMPPPHVLKE